jgi:hypothetical protein
MPEPAVFAPEAAVLPAAFAALAVLLLLALLNSFSCSEILFSCSFNALIYV